MKTIAYKGYHARVEFDGEDEVFVGHVAGIGDIVGFHADNVENLIRSFHEAVDDYVAACEAAGKHPEKPYSGKEVLRVSVDVHAEAVRNGQDEAIPGLAGYSYEPRPIRFLGVDAARAGWRVKRYAITAPRHGGLLPEAAAAASESALAAALHAAAGDVHGIAILTAHLGLQGFWVLVDWWASGDLLMHRHFRAPVEDPAALLDVSGQGFGPCVWELAVQAHERGAWLRHVLARSAQPDLGAYLADGLTAVV